MVKKAETAVSTVTKSLKSLVLDERKKVTDQWCKPPFPVFKQVTELAKTSWAMKLLGSYKKALEVRKD